MNEYTAPEFCPYCGEKVAEIILRTQYEWRAEYNCGSIIDGDNLGHYLVRPCGLITSEDIERFINR